MRTTVFAVLLCLAGGAAAQESYSTTATAQQVSDLRQHVLALNRVTCRRLQLTAACSQAQACVAANAAGGASCTAAQARAANVRIWPDAQAGREEFIMWTWIVPRMLEARAALAGLTIADYCVWWDSQNQTTKDAECAKIGAPASCFVCP